MSTPRAKASSSRPKHQAIKTPINTTGVQSDTDDQRAAPSEPSNQDAMPRVESPSPHTMTTREVIAAKNWPTAIPVRTRSGESLSLPVTEPLPVTELGQFGRELPHGTDAAYR